MKQTDKLLGIRYKLHEEAIPQVGVGFMGSLYRQIAPEWNIIWCGAQNQAVEELVAEAIKAIKVLNQK